MSVDLTTTYLGMKLANPLVISACPLTAQIEELRRLEQAGASAAVMPSLFEEQIEHDAEEMIKVHEFHTDSFAESLTYFPEPEEYRTGPGEYLETIAAAKKAVKIPIVASLNGASRGGWVSYAKMMQDAGADALELNVYFVAADPDMTGRDVESRYLELVANVKESISIPLAVKVGPYFSAMANMGLRLAEAGADGLVLFNRFYQPDINLETLEAESTLHFSTPAELLLPLRWIALLHGRLDAFAGGHRRDPRRRRAVEGPAGGRRRGHDCRHALSGRHRSDRQDSRRRAAVDGGARVRFGRATQRQHEPRKLPRPVRLPARQLHENPDLVRRQSDLRRGQGSVCRVRETHHNRSCRVRFTQPTDCSRAFSRPRVYRSRANCRRASMPRAITRSSAA